MWIVTSATKLKDTCSLEEKLCKHQWHIKKQRHHFADKGPSSQSYGFSSSHVQIWELDCKESWVLKNWCFWTVVFEKTLESPSECKEFKPVNPKGDQSWIFIGRMDIEAETPILWLPDTKNLLTRKDPDTGKDWRQEEKETSQDKIIGWHHRQAWVWANSRNWWWTGKSGMLQSMGLQRIWHDWATELDRTEWSSLKFRVPYSATRASSQFLAMKQAWV